MNRFRVIQVSDTHLAREPKFPLENWRALAAHIKRRDPDLVIHTGDVTVDGVKIPEQLHLARTLYEDLTIPFLVLPGNHDVGEIPETAGSGELEPAVSEEACERFIDCFGQDRFAKDIDGWRLIGANALLFGSGIPSEAKQWQYLESAFAGAEGRQIALFLHKPLYRDGLGDTSKPPNMLPRSAVERFDALLQGSRGRIVSSGHLHEHRLKEIAGVRNVWAPSTSFVIDEVLSRPRGTRQVGFVQFDFEGDDVAIEIVCPEDMTSHLFLDHPDFYPDIQKSARASIARREANQLSRS